MVMSAFWKLFPPPRYLAMSPVGLDISDRAIKYAAFRPRGGGLKLACHGEVALPSETIVGGVIKNAAALSEALRGVVRTSGYREAVVALPEEASFVVTMELPRVERAELGQGVELQLEEHVPLPATGVVFDYQLLGARAADGESSRVAVTAFPKAVAESYLAALETAGIWAAALETESWSLGRALNLASGEVALLVDLGRWRTGLALLSGGTVLRSVTISEIGGEAFTSALARGLNLSAEAAEKRKRSPDLLAGSKNEATFAILPLLSVLRDEIAKFAKHWSAEAPSLARVILVGGQALLPGLREYLQPALAVPVVLGNPWARLGLKAAAVPPLPLEESLGLATALGAAWRPFVSFGQNHD